MSFIAERYISELDPQIDTQVKNGHVMASIRKRFTDEEGEYWPYLWGAFSRGRKQEDAQLFVGIHPERLRFGFGLGSSPSSDLIEHLRSAVRDHPDHLLRAIEPIRNNVQFEADGDDRIEVESAEDLSRWAASPRPQIVRAVEASDPLATSAELSEEVGIMLRAVHPFARAAWGDLSLDEEVDDAEDVDVIEEPYTLAQVAKETFLPQEELEEWVALLQGPKRQALLYGSPGTSKTFVAKRLARYLAGDVGEVETVQFHPSFSYEDFLEGLRPRTDAAGLKYEYRAGVFVDFCERARGKDATYVFVIDEINRADLGSVLGELMMLLEYRKEKVPLPYSQRQFSVPANVVLIATMNTADRSLALVDYALRRRFHAIQMRPNREVLKSFLKERDEPDDSVALRFFDLIQQNVDDQDYAPGHSYWMVDDLSLENLQRVWRYEVKPYLDEFWFENRQRVSQLEEEVNVLLAEEA
jgi:MoxR-like ATPase